MLSTDQRSHKSNPEQSRMQVREDIRLALSQTIAGVLQVLKGETISIWRDTRYSVFFSEGEKSVISPSNPKSIIHAESMETLEQEMASIRTRVEECEPLSERDLRVIHDLVSVYRDQNFLTRLLWRLFE